MKFAKAVKHKQFTPFAVECAALYLALFFISAAVSQLFAFEDFPPLIASYNLPIFTDGWSLIFASIIVTLEIAAVPYLLSMQQSPLAHMLSHVAGWIMVLFWLAISIWQSLFVTPVASAGIFGAKVVVPQGWWLVTYIIILILLYALVDFSKRRKFLPISHGHLEKPKNKKST